MPDSHPPPDAIPDAATVPPRRTLDSLLNTQISLPRLALYHRLPRWARLDHPVLRREFGLLPDPATRFDWLRLVFIPSVILFLTAGACVFSGAGVPLQLALIPLSFAPLIYAVPVLLREREHHTWDTLRATPFGAREVVLAKFMALVYRLGTLWAALLVGQVGSLLGGGLTALTFGRAGSDAGRQRDLLLALIALLVLTVIMHTLDYLTNILLGMLASALPFSRSLAYAGAFGFKLAYLLAFMLLSILLVFVFSGQGASPGSLVFSVLLAGYPGWVVLAMDFAPGAALGIALALLAAQGVVFAGLLVIVLRQAEQL